MEGPLDAVRRTTAEVAEVAERVKINRAAISSLVREGKLREDCVRSLDLSKWDETDHLDPSQDAHLDDDTRCQYLFAVDAINFCFWPDGELEYEHVAGGLKESVRRTGGACVSSESLAKVTGPELRGWLSWPRPLPQERERARLLNELGGALNAHFGGRASEMVRRAGGSASELVRLILAHLPGFRDACVYRGRQVFLYKRAQILVGDLYGSFRGQGLGAFRDVGKLTMFADYRVPVTLLELGVLEYDADLARRVRAREEIASGSEEEVEIRALTVHAVEVILEEMREAFEDKALVPKSIELDWFLWREGENRREVSDPHHRALTVFY